MSRSRSLVSLLITAFLLFFTRQADALTCNISGSVRIEPRDRYYCDSNFLNCGSWLEANIDTMTGPTAAPMQYMYVDVRQSGGGSVGHGVTDANGNYSATLTFSSGSCAGKVVNLRHYFNRIHEADIFAAAPRERFVLVEIINETGTNPQPEPGTNAQFYQPASFTLTGTNSTAPLVNFPRAGTPSDATRAANIYYTANSFMKEAITWSSNLSSGFSVPSGTMPLRIGYESTWDGGGVANGGWWGLLIGWNRYVNGAILRHELGHLAHHQMHHRQRNSACQTYNFNTPLTTDPLRNQYSDRSCEYGSSATSEGIASFLAVRSITHNDTNPFWCKCENSNQDVCSSLGSSLSDSDGDQMTGCAAGTPLSPIGFLGVGDVWANDTSDCIRLRQDEKCNCLSSPCETSFWQSKGFRNFNQVTRFLWDMIDSSNDSSMDDTNLSIQELVAEIEGMTCSATGVDGSCDEQAGSPPFCGIFPLPPCGCRPATDGGVSPNDTGTRDSYNMYDFGDMIAGDQSDERTLNCVQGAQD